MSPPLLKAFVHEIHRAAHGIVSVELRPAADDVVFPAFTAGAHIDLHLPNGVTRSYSLCNDQNDSGRYVVAVADDRNSRGGSRYINTQLSAGATLSVSTPRNNFGLNESAESYVLLAGGIGVTPLYSMLRRLAHLEKRVTFIYCARSRREAAFCADIAALACETIEVMCHFDEEAGGPPSLQALLSNRGRENYFYCCGPGPMLDTFVATCESLSYRNAAIERFSASHPHDAATGHPYQLELRRSGKTLHVPQGKSPLRVMIEAGVDVDFGCEEGVCGACETRVFEGAIDHRDDLLSNEAKASNKTMLICVSGCKSERLVLDL